MKPNDPTKFDNGFMSEHGIMARCDGVVGIQYFESLCGRHSALSEWNCRLLFKQFFRTPDQRRKSKISKFSIK